MKPNTRFLHTGLVALATLTLQVTAVIAQGTAFSYTGHLNDGGSPANGNYDLRFGVYDASAGGNLVAGPLTTSAISVASGLFTVTLDFGGGVFTGPSRWLEIAVRNSGGNSFTTLNTRAALTPVPYSIFSGNSAHANQADGVLSGSVSALQLNTSVAPAAGQVLGYNGAQLTWQAPVIGGNSGGWSLAGNLGTTAGANFLGTLDSQPLELRVGGARALRLEPDASANGAPNVIGGSAWNLLGSGVVGATIAGGGGVNLSNRVTAAFGTVGGGVKNTAGGQQSLVGGGFQNLASGYISTVAGGAYNGAITNEAAVLGGAYNLASGIGSAVVGGGYDGTLSQGNLASGGVAFVGGGLGGIASGYAASIAGGEQNNATGDTAAVSGGSFNTASGNDTYTYFLGHLDFFNGGSSVGGGYNNTASASGATVPGGALNTASGDLSFAAGFRANATNAGTFVWADTSSSVAFSSSVANQFLIRATGGIGIGTAQTPPGGLRVASGGLAVTGASSPRYPGSAGVFIEKLSTAGAIYAYDYNATTTLPLVLNTPGGNVGIGTTTPQNTLDVNGTTRTHSIIITGGANLAEPFRMGATGVVKGSVVVIDPAHPGELKLSTAAYDTRVAGVVSGANGIHPGIALHQEGSIEGGQNVALSGRVYALADATVEPIEPGDLLTTSSTPGHAMKAADHIRAPGAVLGKAMSRLAEGKGLVLVLVTLQ